MRRLVSGLIALAILGGCKRQAAPAPPPNAAKNPATAPTTSVAATAPAPPPLVTFGELVKKNYPDAPSTQPLDTPVDLVQAARITLPNAIYLDRLQNIWITSDQAEDTKRVLADAWNQTEHLIREQPLYVHWRTEPGDKNHSPHSTPVLFCLAKNKSELRLVEEARTVSLPLKAREYQWPNAVSFNESVVVGVSDGALALVRTESGWTQVPCPPLIDPKQPHEPTAFAVDANGVLAYVPPGEGSMGSAKTSHFADGKWTILQDSAQWPGHFVDLIPLTDGTVLQIIQQPPKAEDAAAHKIPQVRLAMGMLDVSPIDSQPALDLIKQLNDDDAKRRQDAFERLAVYGASLWPIMEAQLPKQPPAAQEKLQLLLKNKTHPLLGEVEPIDYRLQLVARTASGGALFYAKAGVAVTDADGDPTLVAPAWINASPGQPIHLLIGDAWADVTPQEHKIFPMGSGDWLIWDQDSGPHEIVGALSFSAILKPEELAFSEFAGVDRDGRWLFHEPGDDGQWLILDPTMLPVTPQLPVWSFKAPSQGVAGWDQNDWPAYRDTDGNVWMIEQTGFRLENQKAAHFYNAAVDVPAPRTATTRSSSRPSEPLLLVDPDGTEYYGGVTDLMRITHGKKVDCPLPPEAKGTFERPWLVKDQAGHLYLLNQPGQLVRLASEFKFGQPMKIEATFTQDIPKATPLRVWIDPADRIILLHDENELAIGFTKGVIPASIMDKITSQNKDQ